MLGKRRKSKRGRVKENRKVKEKGQQFKREGNGGRHIERGKEEDTRREERE